MINLQYVNSTNLSTEKTDRLGTFIRYMRYQKKQFPARNGNDIEIHFTNQQVKVGSSQLKFVSETLLPRQPQSIGDSPQVPRQGRRRMSLCRSNSGLTNKPFFRGVVHISTSFVRRKKHIVETSRILHKETVVKII